MARYIDADALIKKIFPYDVVDKKCYSINAEAVYKGIEKIPTADVIPKEFLTRKEDEAYERGYAEAKSESRWVLTKELDVDMYSVCVVATCKNCGSQVWYKRRVVLNKYCSGCGAKMNAEPEQNFPHTEGTE